MAHVRQQFVLEYRLLRPSPQTLRTGRALSLREGAVFALFRLLAFVGPGVGLLGSLEVLHGAGSAVFAGNVDAFGGADPHEFDFLAGQFLHLLPPCRPFRFGGLHLGLLLEALLIGGHGEGVSTPLRRPEEVAELEESVLGSLDEFDEFGDDGVLAEEEVVVDEEPGLRLRVLLPEEVLVDPLRQFLQ